MAPVMEENLSDLKDIKGHMNVYYPSGQEYIRQLEIYRNYQKAAERWKPENKMKYIVGSVAGGIIITPLILIGILAAVGLYFGYDKITESKKAQCEWQAKKVEELRNKFQESYNPVQEKCKRLLFNRDDYEVPMVVDYLIEMIENSRADTMKEAYSMLDEQLHRWKMEQMQNDVLEMQKRQSKQLRNIEINSAAGVAFDIFNMIK